MNKNRILAGITQDDELYFLDIDKTNNNRNGYPEFSMCGDTNKPITEEEVKAQANDFDYTEYWQQAVQSGNTTLGLDEWTEQAKDEDERNGFDNSMFDAEIEDEDGTVWLFSSESCGQHEEKSLKHYFINEKLFHCLMKVWKKYHLKELPQGADMSIVDEALLIKQDFEKLALEAIKIINQ